ncbi:hypothetical protein SEA_KELCOLE_68 [Microbacterium phage Kelcole]|nr:hypothetical protein SEA_KELCOLE_68 [Microbacterium phage Kelcole]
MSEARVIKLPKEYRRAQRWMSVCYACADHGLLVPPGIFSLQDGRTPLVGLPRRRMGDALKDALRHDREVHP